MFSPYEPVSVTNMINVKIFTGYITVIFETPGVIVSSFHNITSTEKFLGCYRGGFTNKKFKGILESTN